MAAAQLADGTVELAAIAPSDGILHVFTVDATTATLVGSFSATSDVGYGANWYLQRGRVVVQEVGEGQVHVFAEDNGPWIHAVRQVPDPYEIMGAFVWPRAATAQRRTGTSVVRPDGSIDAMFSDFWCDGSTMMDAEPTCHHVAYGSNPQLVRGEDGRVVLSFYEDPVIDPLDPPPPPYLSVVRLYELANGGVAADSWAVDAPANVGVPGTSPCLHDVLWADGREAAIVFDNCGSPLDGPWYLIHVTASDRQERELLTVDVPGRTARIYDAAFTFEPCSGFQGMATVVSSEPGSADDDRWEIARIEW